MVMPCSRSARSPSVTKDRSTSPIPRRADAASTAAIWSSKSWRVSKRRRPMSVDLPSSTEPTAANRRRSIVPAPATGVAPLPDATSRSTPRACGPPSRSRRTGRRPGLERDQRAVLPQPFERVEGTLVGMLHVDDDVDVVEQHPAALALAFPAGGLGTGQPQPGLDLVDDRPDLADVGRRTEQERVGDHELLTLVVSDDAAGELVRRGCRGDLDELNGSFGCCHVCCSSSVCWLIALGSHARAGLRPGYPRRTAGVSRCIGQCRPAPGTRSARPSRPWPGTPWTRWSARGSRSGSPSRLAGRRRSAGVPAGYSLRNARG